MGLFGWGKKHGEDAARAADGAGSGEMDAALPFFTAAEAARFRALVVRTLAELGVAAEADDERVRLPDGTEYGYWNMAAQCHDGGDGREEDWPAIVRAHVEALSAAGSHDDIGDMTDAELLAAMKWRLSEAEGAAPVVSVADASTSEFAPGVLKHLVVDLPQTVMTVSADTLAGRIGVEDLARAADVNTRAVWEREEFETQQLGDLPVHAVVGDSFFTATMALYLTDVARQLQPGVPQGFGIVFALPYRHMLLVHVPQDAVATQELVPPLLEFVKRTYAEAPGGVSPELFYYDDGQVMPLTHTTDGHVRVEVRGALADLFTIQGQAGDGPGEG